MPEGLQEQGPGLPAQEPHTEALTVSARQCKQTLFYITDQSIPN